MRLQSLVGKKPPRGGIDCCRLWKNGPCRHRLVFREKMGLYSQSSFFQRNKAGACRSSFFRQGRQNLARFSPSSTFPQLHSLQRVTCEARFSGEYAKSTPNFIDFSDCAPFSEKHVVICGDGGERYCDRGTGCLILYRYMLCIGKFVRYVKRGNWIKDGRSSKLYIDNNTIQLKRRRKKPCPAWSLDTEIRGILS